MKTDNGKPISFDGRVAAIRDDRVFAEIITQGGASLYARLEWLRLLGIRVGDRVRLVVEPAEDAPKNGKDSK